MAKKRTNKLEPFIDPKTKMMRVGSFTIPPSTVITGLLVGFANHTQVRQREYYFWRICDELWNNSDLPEPLMVKHPYDSDGKLRTPIASFNVCHMHSPILYPQHFISIQNIT